MIRIWEKIAISTWKKSDKNTRLIFNRKETDTPAEYLPEKRHVLISLHMLPQEYKNVKHAKIKVTKKELLESSIAHELRHSEDPNVLKHKTLLENYYEQLEAATIQKDQEKMEQKAKEINELTLKMEKFAWSELERYLPWTKTKRFERLCDYYLNTYRLGAKELDTAVEYALDIQNLLQKSGLEHYVFDFYNLENDVEYNEEDQEIVVNLISNVMQSRLYPYLTIPEYTLFKVLELKAYLQPELTIEVNRVEEMEEQIFQGEKNPEFLRLYGEKLKLLFKQQTMFMRKCLPADFPTEKYDKYEENARQIINQLIQYTIGG